MVDGRLGTKRVKALLRNCAVGAFVFLAAACATDSHRALIPIESEPEASSNSSWALQYEALQRLLKDEPNLAPLVTDFAEVLQAEITEEKQDWEGAAKHWLAALKLDRGAISKIAFQRWTGVQAKMDPNLGSNPEALARILLAETKDGEESPWLKKQSLTSKAALTKKFQSLVAQKTLSEPVPTVLPAPESFLSDDDLFWEKRAKAVCKKSLDTRWVLWSRKLSAGQRSYWDGLLAHCEGEPKKAAKLFYEAVTKLSDEPEDKAKAVRAAELQIASLKAVGDRVGATEAYLGQSILLKRDDLPLSLLKWSAFEKQRRYIESIYWVARNRAMEGEYERAKIAAHEGIEGIAQLLGLAQGPKELQQASELKVDGYNILASRISYEQLDYNGALELNRLSLETPNLSTDWRLRLLWSQGWYEYRKGEKKRAIDAWKVFLAEKLEDSLRTKALYWSGRAYWELGNKAAATEEFKALQNLAPLSFYSVVAVPQIDPTVDWTDGFKKAQGSKLSKIDSFDWGAYQDDAEAMRRFHRLEVALRIKSKPLYEGLGLELFEQVNGKPKLLKDVEPTLYATRLLHMARQYGLSISLSSTLSQTVPHLWHDYPEQLLIFFPTPFRSDVERFASQTFLDPDLVWGLSRQESSFRPTVESPVGAIGLMQLMPTTAQEQARTQGLSPSGIAERLRRPELNLQLGTAYLAKLGKRYQNKWPRAIAAYNAGEYVVDTWIERRDSPDMVVWAEALSFGETSSYVKNVWRNWEVYHWLRKRR
ncbi:MAG: lytic transglycosylase domain-containing protein [Chitinophagaceae bacterium]|nr:lytic transglycosylase domain-containing protein [Oligoflexus sp.]